MEFPERVRFAARFGATRFIPMFIGLYIPTYILLTIIGPLQAVIASHVFLGSFITWILFKEEERFENVSDGRLLLVAFAYWLGFLIFNIGIFIAYGVLKIWDQ